MTFPLIYFFEIKRRRLDIIDKNDKLKLSVLLKMVMK